MDCKRYQNSLTEAALGELDRAQRAELEAHLAGCSNCRAGLERERMLVTAIDQDVAASVATELSPGFAARVRARLAEEAARPGFRFGGSIPAAAGALAALALAAVWLANVSTGRRPDKPAVASAPMVTPPIVAEKTEPSRTARESVEKTLPRKRPAATRKVNTSEPEVLVEKGQWAAVIELYDAVWSHHADASAIAEEPAPGEIRSLEPVPLEIKPLEMAKLEPEASAGSAAAEALPRM